jgi:hypothetical protein
VGSGRSKNSGKWEVESREEENGKWKVGKKKLESSRKW